MFETDIEYDDIDLAVTVEVTVGGQVMVLSDGEIDGALRIGSVVALTAIADNGWRFVGWQDGHGNFVSTDAVYSFVIFEDMMFKALFVPIMRLIRSLSVPSKCVF